MIRRCCSFRILVWVAVVCVAEPAAAYRTVRSEIETWPEVAVESDPTCSARAAATVAAVTRHTIALPTRWKYARPGISPFGPMCSC